MLSDRRPFNETLPPSTRAPRGRAIRMRTTRLDTHSSGSCATRSLTSTENDPLLARCCGASLGASSSLMLSPGAKR
jgi:hypothetical protein